MDLEDIWFQKDGATSHTANVRINLLETKFGESVILRNGPVGWPPRYMVYANKPATIDELRTNIEHEITAVLADLCLKIVKNWVQRLDFCFIHNGIERSFTGIKNFIDIQNRFCLFKLLKNPLRYGKA